MRLKWRRSRFSRRIMIHIVPHCATYTGSITVGTSFTNVMAPVMWYTQVTWRICSHGIGMFAPREAFFLRGLDVSELAGRAVSLGVELLPFAAAGAREGGGTRRRRGHLLVALGERAGFIRDGKRARGATRCRRTRGDCASHFSVCALR